MEMEEKTDNEIIREILVLLLRRIGAEEALSGLSALDAVRAFKVLADCLPEPEGPRAVRVVFGEGVEDLSQ